MINIYHEYFINRVFWKIYGLFGVEIVIAIGIENIGIAILFDFDSDPDSDFDGFSQHGPS